MAVTIIFAILAVAAALVAALARRVDPKPFLDPRPLSQMMNDTVETRLGRMLCPLASANPGLSGVHTLDDPREAFAARVILIRSAERCLDIQYYIWHPDVSGMLLVGELRRAADRGVRVRLLLDDNGTDGLDRVIAALDSHANIEVRLFNPFVLRWPKALGYLLDFGRLNRRMHNKSLTADNAATIIGGRNIGDEYFGASEKDLFADFDVMAIGAIVPEVSADFDRYWACDSAFLANRILPPAPEDALIKLAADVAERQAEPLARQYAATVVDSVIDRMLSGDEPLEWAPVTMVSDDPAKGLGAVRDTKLLATRLAAVVGEPQRELGLVSAYFVPTDEGVALFSAMAGRGVKVDVLTNALKSNDVAMVHAGYAPCRAPLLQAGLRLWEMKGADPDRRARLRFRGGRTGSGGRAGPVFRSSGSALHAKAFAIDRQRLFVGSFNFDPRSVHLNTEMGFVIDSPLLAGRLQDLFGESIHAAAYEVMLDTKGLKWIERTDTGIVVHHEEPGTGPLQRFIVRLLSWLPVKWLL